jgi:hypothetical protein
MNIEQTDMWNKLTDTPGNYYMQSSEEERTLFRDWVKGVLKTSTATVDFVKADGTQRSMLCTLNEEQGAKYTVTENAEKKKAPNPDVCVVWDCKQNAWRSFRWDRMKGLEITIG